VPAGTPTTASPSREILAIAGIEIQETGSICGSLTVKSGTARDNPGELFGPVLLLLARVPRRYIRASVLSI
jgi:hypothetical protein